MKSFLGIFLAAALTAACCLPLDAQVGRWVAVDSLPAKYGTLSLVCADSNNCISLSRLPAFCVTILRHTSDGGLTWSEIYNDSLERVKHGVVYSLCKKQISYPEMGLCVLSCDSGAVRISRDSLKSWDNPETDSNSLYHFQMFDRLHGFQVADKYNQYSLNISYTNDGGITWSVVAIPEKYRYYNIGLDQILPIAPDVALMLCLDEENGYRIVRYQVRDSSWSDYLCTVKTKKLFFLDSLRGWMLADEYSEDYSQTQYIEATDDGGRTWKTIRSSDENTPFLEDICFYDENNGISIGSGYTLIRTKDGGKTWHKDQLMDIPVDMQGENDTPALKQIGYLSHNSGLILGNKNVIYKYLPGSVPVKDDGIQETEGKPFVFPNPARRDELQTLKLIIPDGFINSVSRITIYNTNGVVIADRFIVQENYDNSIELTGFGSSTGSGFYYIRLEADGVVWYLPLLVY